MEQTDVMLTIEDGVAFVTLNRPEKLNALNENMLRRLNEVLVELAGMEAVRVVVLRGAGRAFSSGQDLTLDVEADYGEYLQDVYHPLVRTIASFEKPFLAALHGVVAGAGLSLALAADLRIADAGVRLSSAFINIGLVADAGGPFYLRRLLRSDLALDWIWSGRTVDGAEAERLGVVTHLVPSEEYEAFVKTYASRLASRPDVAVRGMKALLRAETLNEELEREIQWQRACGETEAHRFAIRAFLERT